MADRLQALLDRAEITDLIHGYALAVRHGRVADIAPMFTPDGAYRVFLGNPLDPAAATQRSSAEGREAIVAQIAKSTAAARPWPALHNILITLEGDRAMATSLMASVAFPGGIEVMGEYADRLRRDNGKWRFVERRFTIVRQV